MDGSKIWIAIQSMDGAFVVKLGDHGHNANHQVVVNSNYNKLSIATFQNPAPEAIVYLLKVRAGEKLVLEEPVMFSKMYKGKLSKNLVLVRLKKLAKEKQLNQETNVKPELVEEILA
ncbi:Naringenin [Abeliophyllum distichum]|uniref:Naringenin n=1 Tax=Abeliophyllum distichum TaxID=126358 RepID=A0ABD1Q4S5_9LAMI